MRVVEERPRLLDGELVHIRIAWLDRRLGDIRGAVHFVRDDETVPVDRGRLRQVVRHVESDAVADGESDRRPRNLVIERVGHHLLVRKDVPLDDRDLEIEHLHVTVEARLQRLRPLSVDRRREIDLVGGDRGHLPHGLAGCVPGHEHPGWHDRAADVTGAEPKVHPVGRVQDPATSASIEAIDHATNWGRVGRSAIGRAPCTTARRAQARSGRDRALRVPIPTA